MGGQRLTPTPAEIVKFRRGGLTHQQIAERWEQQTGIRVTRGAITAAIARAGMQERTVIDHSDLIPWRLSPEHLNSYAAQLLRSLGRMRAGATVRPQERSSVTSWLKSLERRNLVVTYISTVGFVYTDRHPNDDRWPIRP